MELPGGPEVSSRAGQAATATTETPHNHNDAGGLNTAPEYLYSAPSSSLNENYTQAQGGNETLPPLGDNGHKMQETTPPGIGIPQIPGLHHSNAGSIELFTNNATDVSPHKTIELQSNNPFRAKVENTQGDSQSVPGGTSVVCHTSDTPLLNISTPLTSPDHSIAKSLSGLSLEPIDQANTGSLQSRNQISLGHGTRIYDAADPSSGSENNTHVDRQFDPSYFAASHVPSSDSRPMAPSSPIDRPGVVPQDLAERLQQHAQPSEIYDIRTIHWTDGTGTGLRQCPVLVQNENGPCPLLALVNSLVLRTPPDVESPLIRALRSRERISLGLLIQALFDELTTYLNEERELPDIEDLSKFLTMLHTGMNVNPRLTPNTDPDQPGMFHQTRDVTLYSAFNLPLVHGWLAPPDSEANKAMLRTAEYHDDIQLLHFRREELEQRVFSGGTLSSDEEQLMKDIDTIQRFVTVENATQLSPFGIEHLNRSLAPGSLSILFRNDHFSTLFKHPQSHQLFTLVSDAGYASHAEVVWESLVDVNGSASELFSGDFRPVGAAPAAQEQRHELASTAEPVQDQPDTHGHLSDHSEQTDADYAYALALQFQDEEDARARTDRRPQPPPSSPQWQPVHHRASASQSTTHRRQSTGHRQLRQPQTVRPLVPPTQGLTAHHSASQDENLAPPTYEQAALTPPYNPDQPTAAGYTGIAGPRTSSYGRAHGYGHGHSQSHPGINPRIPMNQQQSPGRRMPAASPYVSRPKDKNKDCAVM